MREMKLMDLAKLVWKMNVGDVIDFVEGTEDVACGWCGVKRIDVFDNDNPMYIVSMYGGEAEAVLYHLSEYDHRIGNFCEPRLTYRIDGSNRKEKDWIECCGRMLADYLETHSCGVSEVITVDIDDDFFAYITIEEAIRRYVFCGEDILLIYDDGTEAYAECLECIVKHDGRFAYEKGC